MAETKTTTTRRKKNETVVVNDNNDNIKITTETEDALEKEKEKNEQLSEMLKQMQEQLIAMQNQINNSNSNTPNIVVKQNDLMSKSFKVISMLPNEYILSTLPLGKGKVYSFAKFGDYHTIKYSDMQDILSVFLHQFEKGWAIFQNKSDYEDLGYEYIYDQVMNKETLERLISLQDEDSVDTILDMDEDTREIMANLIAQKIADGNSYDYNKIKDLEEEGLAISEISDLIKASNNS